MDPNANLAEQRELVSKIRHIENMVGESAKAAGLIYPHAVRLAELAEALDTWLCGEGFLPEAWEGEG